MIRHPQGYIALISVIVIGAILLVAVASLSFTGYLHRFVILDSELKESSLTLAEACASHAMGELVKDEGYAPVNLDKDIYGVPAACTIESVTPAGSSRNIIARSAPQDVLSRVRVTFIPSTLTIASWNEIP